jgi:hypothetical protein
MKQIVRLQLQLWACLNNTNVTKQRVNKRDTPAHYIVKSYLKMNDMVVSYESSV